MKRFLPVAALALCCATILAVSGQAQAPLNHIIAVSGNATVMAKPDLGILSLTVQSSTPFAAQAVENNAQKTKRVESALAALGYAPSQFKVTSVAITRAGGPYYGPNQPQTMGVEASQFVYVFFEGADLADPAALSEKAATVIDALSKAGALPSSLAGPPFFPQRQMGTLVYYTVKDPSPYEKEAVQEALDKARAEAQAVAKQMGVQITSLNWTSTGVGRIMPQQQLEGLPYRYYSTEGDAVKISEMATVRYNFK